MEMALLRQDDVAQDMASATHDLSDVRRKCLRPQNTRIRIRRNRILHFCVNINLGWCIRFHAFTRIRYCSLQLQLHSGQRYDLTGRISFPLPVLQGNISYTSQVGMSKRNNQVKADSFVWSESKQRVVGLYFKFFKFRFKPGPEYLKISGFGRLYELAKPDELIKNSTLKTGFNAVSGSGFTVLVQMEGRFVLKSVRFQKYPDSCGRGLNLIRFLFSRNEGCNVIPFFFTCVG